MSSSNNTDTDTINMCANCGKEGGDSLKACTACFMVEYCNRDCQISHRKQHKKECKKRAAELYDEKLFQEVEPEECPICLLPMPIRGDDTTVESCCGKRICTGCSFAIYMSEGKNICAFCRTPSTTSSEEHIKRLNKLMKKGNGEAFAMIASYYTRGVGMPQNIIKANELCLKAGELGCADGYYNLGVNYNNGVGVERDKKKSKHYYELAAMMGSVTARYNLGCLEGQAGNDQRAYKHCILAARAGHGDSLDIIKQMFMQGVIAKD